jgi:hypothetical protein
MAGRQSEDHQLRGHGGRATRLVGLDEPRVPLGCAIQRTASDERQIFPELGDCLDAREQARHPGNPEQVAHRQLGQPLETGTERHDPVGGQQPEALELGRAGLRAVAAARARLAFSRAARSASSRRLASARVFAASRSSPAVRAWAPAAGAAEARDSRTPRSSSARS